MKHIILTIFFVFATISFVFSQDGQKATVETSDQPFVSISDSNKLTVQNVKQGDVLQLFSIVGVKVFETKMDSSSKELILNVPKGYYIVKVSNMVRKIVVK